jgi:hypothetical protein
VGLCKSTRGEITNHVLINAGGFAENRPKTNTREDVHVAVA